MQKSCATKKYALSIDPPWLVTRTPHDRISAFFIEIPLSFRFLPALSKEHHQVVKVEREAQVTLRGTPGE
jgi:hypothetical protein